MRTITILVTFLLGFLFAVCPVPQSKAADFQKGLQAFKTGDYKNAINEFKPLAKQGDAKAQYNLGRIYSTSKAALQDKQEAIKWFTKAAEQKDAFSQYSLGHLYAQEKRNLYKDYVESFAWYNLSLSQGNESARKGRDGVKVKMTPEQLSKGWQRYKQLLKKIYGGK